MSESIRRPRIVMGVIAAAAGGFVGILIFGWMFRQGFYALILPAGLLGLAGGYGVRSRSIPFAIVCGVAGLGIGLFTEWHFRPFAADKSFQFFITHMDQLTSTTLLMLVIGTVISFRLALGMDGKR